MTTRPDQCGATGVHPAHPGPTGGWCAGLDGSELSGCCDREHPRGTE